MQNNESIHRSHTLHKNELKIDHRSRSLMCYRFHHRAKMGHRSKCKVQTIKPLDSNIGENLWYGNIFL